MESMGRHICSGVPGHIYVLKSMDYKHKYKIGKTCRPSDELLGDYKRGYNDAVLFEWVLVTNTKLEKNVHRELDKYNNRFIDNGKRSELFTCPIQRIRHAIAKVLVDNKECTMGGEIYRNLIKEPIPIDDELDANFERLGENCKARTLLRSTLRIYDKFLAGEDEKHYYALEVKDNEIAYLKSVIAEQEVSTPEIDELTSQLESSNSKVLELRAALKRLQRIIKKNEKGALKLVKSLVDDALDESC